ncbi:hypothetical protein M9H77_25259 [Catharanthus roseus]|uniref:Uncharacterized protein n=1 Tax=Catharanthus roseus TaxID=4058 RepID=A0ACC0A7A2_CATRO|nr:hypothetical protein M9H77_25259 [Catharanthus roseus]
MQKASILHFAFLLLFSISWAVSAHFDNSTAISQVIFVPNNPSYPLVLNSRTQNLRFQTPETPHPQVIIIPNHESQIQAAIRCAKKHGLQMRIRSGGHDFSDVQGKTAWFGVGATLGEVYYTIYQANNSIYFPGGSAPTVGVGGLVSGGGNGPYSRKLWTCC